MDPSDFAQNMPGRLAKIPHGVWAFIPSPLPPHLGWDLPTVRQLSEADRALGELARLGSMLPNPYLLIRPFLHREAVLSSRIEGTMAGLHQLLLFQVAPWQEIEAPDVREVSNYVAAMEHGLKRLGELPMCLRLIREIHEHLLAAVRGEDRMPGQFRRGQNFIAQRGLSIHEARFVPPPVPEMQQALHELERFMNTPSGLPILVELALIHYQFEAIHPFMDGNGRVGRLLISLLLSERKILPQPLLYLSAYFDEHREVYMDHLLRVSQAAAWADWITFFLRGVEEQSRDAIRRSQRLLDLGQDFKRRVQGPRASSLLLQLVDQLFAWPAITISRAQHLLEVTYASAQRNIEKLEAAGILREVTGHQRYRVYVAPEIIEIIEAPEA